MGALSELATVCVIQHAVTGSSSRIVIMAACDLLVEGYQGVAMADFAGLPLDSIRSEVIGPLFRACEEAGLNVPDQLSDATRALALRSASRRDLAGRIPARAFTNWVWSSFANDTPEAVVPFLDLEYDYDMVDAIGDPPPSDDDVRAVAERYLQLSLDDSVARRPRTPGTN